jgi:hypothetical protein
MDLICVTSSIRRLACHWWNFGVNDDQSHARLDDDMSEQRQPRYVGFLRINRKTRFVVVECLNCGCYHRLGYTGDCRDDAERISDPHEYATEHGMSEIDSFSLEEVLGDEDEGRGETK